MNAFQFKSQGLTPPRILHLRVAAGTGGGPEKTILNSPKFIRQHGYDAQITYLCPPHDPLAESLSQRAIDCQANLTVIPDRGALDVKAMMQVVRMCKRERIDILQTHDYKSNVLGLIVRRFHRCRLATTLHGWTDMSGRMPLYKRIDQWCLPFYEALICVSEDLVDACHKLHIPAERIHLVHNAIDHELYRRRMSIADAKTRVSARQGRFLIGSVGRLSEEKCFAQLIDVIVGLQRQGKAIDLWIAGDGPLRTALAEKIAQLNCEDSIRLLGQLSDTMPFYQAMDLFVLNSIREGLPNVILEAMALEVPIIATAIAGIPSLITSGKNGHLIEPGDSSGLELSIMNALNHRLQQKEFAENARQVILDQFSFNSRMEKIAAIYDRLLGI